MCRKTQLESRSLIGFTPNSIFKSGPDAPRQLLSLRERTHGRDRRAAVSCGVAVCGGNCCCEPGLAAAALVLVALALVAALCGVAVSRGGRAQRIAWLPLAVLWMLLGAWCAEMEPQPAAAPELAALSDGLLRTVEGTVVDAGPVRTELEQNVDEPTATAPTQRIDLRVATVEVVNDESDAQAPVAGGVRLTVRWPWMRRRQRMCRQFNVASACAQWFVCCRRRPIAIRAYGAARIILLDQGITSTATVAIDRVERLGQAPGAFVRAE